MNAKTKSTKTEEPKAEDSEPEASETEFVTMRKGGRTLDIHPALVEDHRLRGWRVE